MAINQQAVRKKETFFKDCFLTNLQALYQSSNVQYINFHGKPTFLLTFLTFYTLRGSLDTKAIYEKRLVVAEHTMFKFVDLKVNSQNDRQNDNQSA